MKQVDKRESIRKQAESDLEAFIRLVHPNRVLGVLKKHQDLESIIMRLMISVSLVEQKQLT